MSKRKIILKIVTNSLLCDNLIDRLYYVLDAYSKGEILKDFIVDSVIVREKELDIDQYRSLFEDVEKLCSTYNIKTYAHNHWGLAIDLGIKNIHLPMDSFKELCKSGRIDKFKSIGVSIHSLEEAKFVQENGGNYANFGHVFVTDCKKGLKPRGLDQLQEICENVDIDIFAIGGIDQDNSNLSIKYGAAGVCMMSNIMNGNLF